MSEGPGDGEMHILKRSTQPSDPAIPLLGVHPVEMCSPEGACTNVHHSTTCSIPNSKLPKFPSQNKLRPFCTMGFYTAVEMSELLPQAATWGEGVTSE